MGRNCTGRSRKYGKTNYDSHTQLQAICEYVLCLLVGLNDDELHQITKAALENYNSGCAAGADGTCYMRNNSFAKFVLAQELRRNPASAEQHFSDGSIPAKYSGEADPFRAQLLEESKGSLQNHEQYVQASQKNKQAVALNVNEKHKEWLGNLLKAADFQATKYGKHVSLGSDVYCIPKHLAKILESQSNSGLFSTEHAAVEATKNILALAIQSTRVSKFSFGRTQWTKILYEGQSTGVSGADFIDYMTRVGLGDVMISKFKNNPESIRANQQSRGPMR
ncbi:hypothetical protein Psal006b_00486 [Piscirickettsia salmonis]|uniref:S-transferase n=1 Tax=Piscirickettsia salmonis TaxID=1238 RepID=A0AAC8VJY1_PISSA|nr:hypothetical protein [Piscirickettsia salmonis]AKP72635.1 hypothetical protein PSLF89_492 [Piscirickettsia salmonis LF-89 = ATCC VR-1361]ALB23872.1 S-transferase [Piscirickettsia salmonis]ALY03710.1 hypothetical protein AWE47_13275 [Piscirickettsia salmonis]AMA43272.1 hypothetical protein AWJ11_13500 [Piscirickettsia salmonis]AOS35742.1 hypothetical protein AVM72_10620 [Piscirickettsia salmonis]